jgi:hypothetical protein
MRDAGVVWKSAGFRGAGQRAVGHMIPSFHLQEMGGSRSKHRVSHTWYPRVAASGKANGGSTARPVCDPSGVGTHDSPFSRESSPMTGHLAQLTKYPSGSPIDHFEPLPSGAKAGMHSRLPGAGGLILSRSRASRILPPCRVALGTGSGSGPGKPGVVSNLWPG